MLKENGSMLHIRNLVRAHQGVRILDHLSLTVQAQTVVGLMGASGSGKSTLLRCIQGLDTLDAGEMTCCGKVGLMMQDFQLFPHMTLWENIVYVPQKVIKMNRATAHQRAKNLLETLGLDLKTKHYPHQLSGGQKQRVALIRALSTEPDLLLCDEPTSALDSGTIQDMCVVFQKVRDMGVTLLVASHDIDFLQRISQRLIVLKNGRITGDFTSLDGAYADCDLTAALNLL